MIFLILNRRKDELIRIENLAIDEKYFNEEFRELETFKVLKIFALNFKIIIKSTIF